MQQRRRNQHPLLHPFRIIRQRGMLRRLQRQQLQQRSSLALNQALLHLSQPPDELQILQS
jgi:hypothetical protein